LLFVVLFLATHCASPPQSTPILTVNIPTVVRSPTNPIRTLAPVTPIPTQTLVPATPNPTRTPAPTITPFPTPSNLARVERDVVYCTVNAVALTLDLYLPKPVDNQPLAVAVNIHGGSWIFGDKGKSDSAADIPVFIERGYAVAAINYRLAGQAQFPAQIIDAKCAIRFLRAHAAAYHLDPNRIGAWGCSAGGHLAALLGVTDPSAGFDQGEYLDQSSRVQAVATMTAPLDLTLYDSITRGDMLKRVFGTATDQTILSRASPITYVSNRAAPFLILQGEQDPLIVPSHGENFVKRLTDAGGTAQWVMVKNGHHCFPAESPPAPNRAEISSRMVDFFDQQMRR